ncbi:DUF3231 family protein [Desulfosporosinus sp. OT]|uniref:DUF3231 family protein n=1 Tax=Desulfosporosinus sp. OT TaxID=913865 RepID=UPI000223B043|nr:DUF3231 family protein [Desulfosporosinus sp. OT]EGW40177.1 hypothetical protein DOT_1818 [Desulfosporosinus sp. OT]
MSVCFLKSYVAKSKDTDIHTVLQRALDVSTQRIKSMENIYNSINHPIPEAFGDRDVDSNAKQLFSESFMLLYTRLMHKFVSINYLNALTVCSRSDFRNYFSECVNTSVEIHQKATELLLAKGLLSKYPSIIIPDRVDFVHNKGYFGTYLGAILPFIGENRPLNAIEITYIFSIMETKQLLRTLNSGYSQVVKSEKVRNYISKAKQLADKQLESLGSVLVDEDIPLPSITEILVTDSKESSLSDKLIMSHINLVLAYIISEYGIALTSSTRVDLVRMFSGFINELLGLAKNGGDLMIEAGWLEKIPETADRNELIQH